MPRLKFKSIEEALEWCFDQIKFSEIDPKTYNRFVVYRHRYKNDKTSLKLNAKNSILDYFGVQQICTYEVNAPKKKDQK